MLARLKVKRETGPYIRIPRSFARRTKLDPMAFRVFLNGRSHGDRYGWKPKICAKECGVSLSAVKQATRRLKAMGYVYIVPHPIKRKQYGYRFRFQPNLPDEKKPWFNEMMRENNGDVDGVVMMPRIDDGKWREDE